MNQLYVIGDPVEHSLSPALHAEFARQTGQQLIFDKQRVLSGEVATTLQHFLVDGALGCAVTVPHKHEALLACDDVLPRAKTAAAVSCIKFSGATIQGDNFDGLGLVRALTHYHTVKIAGQRVLVLGAGGAVQGLLPILLQEKPKQVVVANRTQAKADAVVAQFQTPDVSLKASGLDELAGGFDIVINGTSAGLAKTVPAIPAEAVAGAVCYDMLYSKSGATAFCDWATQHGAQASFDGLSMLVAQGEEAFNWWFGVRPNGQQVYHAWRG